MGVRLYLKDRKAWAEIFSQPASSVEEAETWSNKLNQFLMNYDDESYDKMMDSIPEPIQHIMHYLMNGFGKFSFDVFQGHKGKYKGDEYCGDTDDWMMISDIISSSTSMMNGCFEFPREVISIAQRCGVCWG